jgi:hypothetical protein
VTSSAEDPIVEEIHKVREAIAGAYGNDIRAIMAALRDEQRKHAGLLVSREPKRVSEEATPIPPAAGRRPTPA